MLALVTMLSTRWRVARLILQHPKAASRSRQAVQVAARPRPAPSPSPRSHIFVFARAIDDDER